MAWILLYALFGLLTFLIAARISGWVIDDDESPLPLFFLWPFVVVLICVMAVSRGSKKLWRWYAPQKESP